MITAILSVSAFCVGVAAVCLADVAGMCDVQGRARNANRAFGYALTGMLLAIWLAFMAGRWSL